MKKWFCLSGLALILAACGGEKGALPDAMSLHRALRGTTMPGYRFDRQVNEGSFIVAIQGPAMKTAWSLVVAWTRGGQGPGGGAKVATGGTGGLVREPDMVAVGTTVWRGQHLPSPMVLAAMLELNAVDLNPGSLALFRDGQGGVFLQYTIRLPAHHLTTRDLEYALGYAAGYAEGIQEKLAILTKKAPSCLESSGRSSDPEVGFPSCQIQRGEPAVYSFGKGDWRIGRNGHQKGIGGL